MYPEPEDGLRTMDRVMKLLEEDELARNNDIYLIFLYWKKYQGLDLDPLIASELLRNAESIRRCRQKIQEEGSFLTTDPSVIEKRGSYNIEYPEGFWLNSVNSS